MSDVHTELPAPPLTIYAENVLVDVNTEDIPEHLQARVAEEK